VVVRFAGYRAGLPVDCSPPEVEMILQSW